MIFDLVDNCIRLTMDDVKRWIVYKARSTPLILAHIDIERRYIESIKQPLPNSIKEHLRKERDKEREDYLIALEEVETHYHYLWSIRHGVPLPDVNSMEYWTVNDDGKHRLTDNGKHLLYKEICIKKQLNREPFIAWGGWIVGIIGAITGLAAVLTK